MAFARVALQSSAVLVQLSAEPDRAVVGQTTVWAFDVIAFVADADAAAAAVGGVDSKLE